MPNESLLSRNYGALVRRSSDGPPFDCLVVGAGSSGLTVAGTLAEAHSDLRILVLEAGPARFLTHIANTELRFAQALSDSVRDEVEYSPLLSDGTTPFGPNYGCLGGRGLFWNGAAPRFPGHDFDGWPITAVDLESEYAWAEQQFRVTQQLGESPLAERIILRLRAIGLDAGPGPFAVDTGSSAPGRLAAGIASGLGVFLRQSGEAVARGQITLCTDTYVQQVVVNNDGDVEGVLARQAGSGADVLKVHARSVVLAGGAVESARLALASNISDPYALIGKGLQEHHFYRCRFDAPALFDRKSVDTAVVHIPSTSQTGEQWELHVPGRTLFTIGDGYDWSPSPGERYQLMLRAFCATDKNAKNSVRLPTHGTAEQVRDKLGCAAVSFVYTEEDQQRRESIRARARQICEQLGMSAGEDIDTADRFRGPGASYHEAGGLDMGTDPSTSVTDPDGAFHEVENLISADAASLPLIGATNPHLTLVALARRKALSLAEKLTAL
ncbi:GMC oxidoreductase [Mycobacterium sp. pW049]|uniref:GMC oxidoreductase n=1 Tax=[Mycobacterium] bulgaricum TaxID=3238985 RepID=UPI00351BE59E